MATKKDLLQILPVGNQSAILNKLQGGTYGNFAEILDWTYYDTAKIATGVQVYNLFSEKVGTVSGGTQKTLADTNMTASGSIPQGQKLDVYTIKCMYTGTGAKDTAFVNTLYQFLANTTLKIAIPGKDSMGTWTLQELMGTATLLPVVPTTAGDNIPVIEPRYTAVFQLNIPIILAALTGIEVTIEAHKAVTAAQNGDLLRVGLNGMLARSA